MRLKVLRQFLLERLVAFALLPPDAVQENFLARSHVLSKRFARLWRITVIPKVGINRFRPDNARGVLFHRAENLLIALRTFQVSETVNRLGLEAGYRSLLENLALDHRSILGKRHLDEPLQV